MTTIQLHDTFVIGPTQFLIFDSSQIFDWSADETFFELIQCRF